MRGWRWVVMGGVALMLAAACADDSDTSAATAAAGAGGGGSGQGGSGQGGSGQGGGGQGGAQTGGGSGACANFCMDGGSDDDCAACFNDRCRMELLACEADPNMSGCDGCSEWLDVLSLNVDALCTDSQTLARALITCACGDAATAGNCN